MASAGKSREAGESAREQPIDLWLGPEFTSFLAPQIVSLSLMKSKPTFQGNCKTPSSWSLSPTRPLTSSHHHPVFPRTTPAVTCMLLSLKSVSESTVPAAC